MSSARSSTRTSRRSTGSLLPRRARRGPHPAQLTIAGFALGVVIGTVLLVLPLSQRGPGHATALEALFTATSALCVTGLVVVDTAVHWSSFGQVVILALIQVGGFGIMALASLLGVLITRRLGLRGQLAAAAETKTLQLGDVRTILLGVARISLLVEAVTALVLAARFAFGYGEPVPRALWLGLFHAVSAFNNAGFALYSDNLIGFATDAWICLPIAVAVIIGGLGFPVLFELRRHLRRPGRWSLHTKITLLGTGVLLAAGSVFMWATEWRSPATLGPMSVPDKLLVGFFQGVMPRTAGFNSVDIAAMNTGTWLGSDLLMFIGGGSAGTAGGVKVTTFLVLLFVIASEARGDEAATAFGRTLPRALQRQALSVALLGVAAVVVPAVLFALTTPFSLDQILYEVISAFATVGLSTGITAQLPVPHQLVLVALMFVGRTGTITLAAALALRSRPRLYALPEERTIVG
ncbi:TrkH family potassium uptake protein [Kineococcus indalonis]|uniref:TrkH family potassium uptake protein n=1 Tax=Kineococcus indalonis TaxID=2696566 RepID=UPI0014122D07|nr:TrkH family potassium uptake protein [Kineococcus indalonis]